jgi:hypothetical protein
MLAPADLQTIEASLESPADRQPAVAAIGGTFMDRGGKPLLCDLTTPLGRLPSRKVRILADIVLESARISTLPRTDRGEPVQQLKEFAADEGFDYRRQRHLFLPRLRRSQRRTAVYPPASARASFTIIRPL